MSLIVIIVTYNAMRWAERCINSLLTSTVIPDIFIVDNGSTDGTQEYIKNHFPSAVFRQNETNLGFGKANNLGLQYALENNYDYVYLLNQDAWVMPDTFEKLIYVQKENPEYGVLSPMQLEANCKRFDKIFGIVCSQQCNNNLINDLYFNRIDKVYPVNDVMAAHWLISRECLKKVGGFSPTFPHYGEDNNFNHRVYFKGMKVGIVPGARAIHDRESRIETKEKKMYMFYVNWLKTLSNPLDNSSHNLLSLIKESISKAKLFKSIMPIKYGVRILCNWRIIQKYKQISKNIDLAFLVNNITCLPLIIVLALAIAT